MQYTLDKLKNGVRLLEIPVRDAASVTVLVLFGVGSRFESREINGLSHFLEHMYFKGSKNRPSAEMISEAVDSVGGEMNAFTNKEYTGYYIKVAGKHGALASDILSDMLLNPLFDAAEIDRERGVITEEIKMYEDQPMLYTGELFENHMYGDTPLGWLIIGPRDNIATVQREQFVQYREKYYTADNMVVVVAGDTTDAIKAARSHFTGFKGALTSSYHKNTTPQPKPPYIMHQKKTEQTHLWVGFRAMAASDNDRFPLRILASILGGGMSSRLFINVRERKGLAYYVRCMTEHYLDSGYITASAGVGAEKFQEAFSTILQEFTRIRDEKVGEKELKKAKEYTKGKLLLSIEQSDNLAELLGLQEVLQHQILTPDEINQRIDLVTTEDVQRVAKQYMTQDRICASVISSIDQSKWLDNNLKV